MFILYINWNVIGIKKINFFFPWIYYLDTQLSKQITIVLAFVNFQGMLSVFVKL